MQADWICGGIALLAITYMGSQLTRLRCLRSNIRQLLCMTRFLRKLLRRSKQLPQSDAPAGSIRQELMDLLQKAPSLAALPCGDDCLPRIAALARGLSPAPEAMLEALMCSDADYTPGEIAALPIAVAFSQAELLWQELSLFERSAMTEAELSSLLWQHAEDFHLLGQLKWLEQCELTDPLHALLMEDPSGTYSRMTAASRLAMRLDAERLARHVHLHRADVVRRALKLSRTAGVQSLEGYVGYWLHDAHGVSQLRRSLGAKSGRIYAYFFPRRALCRYVLRCVLGIIGGFAFLQSGHPVFMLPFFLVCTGSIAKRIEQIVPDTALPTMIPDSGASSCRTLVVLPVVLGHPLDAATQTERLRKVCSICGSSDTDFLLLADLPDHITAVSGQDGLIAASAIEAIAALTSNRCLYLQRGRSWIEAAHIYRCRGGMCGALQEVCRLIVRGESEDAIICSVDPGCFEREYAYLLVLPELIMPGEGLLEGLLAAAAHPMNTRYPGQHGWTGHALLSPENCDALDGCWLLRPDSFLEATEEYTGTTDNQNLLCSALSGHARVQGVSAGIKQSDTSWAARLTQCAEAWRLLPWQLPWVRTHMGILRNPLDYFARFDLRERLREAILPAAQVILLVWALLTRSWPLLALALLTPEYSSSFDAKSALLRLFMLPSRAAVSGAGMLAPWVRRLGKLPADGVLELWAQWIAASVFIGLAIAIPDMRIPGLLLAAGFGAQPLIRPRQQ